MQRDGWSPSRAGATQQTICSRRSRSPPRRAAPTCSSAAFAPTASWIASQRFEWVADGVTAELDNPLMQDMCFDEVGLGRIALIQERNELFAGKVRDFPDSERELFGAQDVLAIASVPIFVDGDWWGFIGFDDCETERTWSAAELDALRTASSLLAAAVRRERSETVLREHEQKLRAVFDTALDAIFITDDERRYVDVNPAGCEYLGVAKRDLIGRKVDEFLPPHKVATIEADWTEFVAGGPILAEWESQRSDGAVRIAEASARPHFLPGLHIAFFRDVTERKRLEAELLSAQKLESLGRLAGGVAHDFNNLLTGITGYATLLLERANGDGELRRDLGEIVRAADRAAELTKQLLAFGRRQVLKAQPLDLNTVVAEVRPLVQRLVGEDVDARDPHRARARDRSRGSRPDRAGDREPRRECAGRDAGRRHAHDRDAEQRRQPGRARLHGHRLGHGRGNDRADLRAVLHHPRAGGRSRPRLGPRNRPPEQRRGGCRELTRRRNRFSHYAPARVRAARRTRSRHQSRQRSRARRRSCSSRTRTSSAT